MKKILHIFIVFLLGLGFLSTSNKVFAAQCAVPISGVGVTFPEYPEKTSHVITIDLSSNFSDETNFWLEYEETDGVNQAQSIKFLKSQNITNACYNGKDCITVKDGIVTWTITSVPALSETNWLGRTDKKSIDLRYAGGGQCDVGDITITDVDSPGVGCKIKAYQNRDGDQCYLNKQQNSCFADGMPIIVEVSELKSGSGDYWRDRVGLRVKEMGGGGERNEGSEKPIDGKVTLSFEPNDAGHGTEYRVKVEDRGGANEAFPNCEFSITTTQGCSSNQCEPETELEIGLTPTSVAQEAFSLCKQIPDDQPEQRAKCEDCTGGTGDSEGNEGVWTAIGCINREPQAILQKLISVGLGMSGGVALLTFLAAGFIFSTSQGDPKAYGTAKEMMTASIVGILFVIFSITLLQFIGFDILKIPGFGGP